MKKNYIWVAILLVIIILFVAVYANREGENSSTVKIGYFGPFTGLLAESTGQSVGDGFKLAESERNSTETNSVQVIYEDDSCDPKKAVSAAQKLIEVDKVNILVSGVCSSATLAVAPIAEQRKIILITPTSASPKISTAGDYVFRLSSPTTGMAQAVIDHLKKLGHTKVALLYENNEYPAGWKDSFVSLFEGDVTVEGIAPGSTDVKSQLLKLSQARPQAYVFTAITPSVAHTILKQFKELGLKGSIVGNDTFSLKSVHRHPEAEGISVVTYSFDLNSDKMQNFLKNYKTQHGRDAFEEIYAALGYDTYNALFESISVCNGGNSDCIRDHLYSLKNIDGVSGQYSIDEQGDTQREFVIRKIQGGKLIDSN